jgi:hypothetical protein
MLLPISGIYRFHFTCSSYDLIISRMDYWISTNNNQLGPYSLQQLQLMWLQGQLTSDTYYYDNDRAEWLLLRPLIEGVQGLFTVEEAFVRLGQNRQTGCLSVYNQTETLNLFVDAGFVVCAIGEKDHGEFALSRALHLENSSYIWFHDAKPASTNLRINITEHVLKHAISRDSRSGNESPRKANTVALPKIMPDKTGAKPNFNYLLVPNDSSRQNIRLVKEINVVGREEYCDIMINDSQISRKHCMLEAGEQNLKVSDLDSHNGTYVNGVLIRKGVLKVGDTISLGSYTFVLKKEQKKAPDLT